MLHLAVLPLALPDRRASAGRVPLLLEGVLLDLADVALRAPRPLGLLLDGLLKLLAN